MNAEIDDAIETGVSVSNGDQEGRSAETKHSIRIGRISNVYVKKHEAGRWEMRALSVQLFVHVHFLPVSLRPLKFDDRATIEGGLTGRSRSTSDSRHRVKRRGGQKEFIEV